MPLDANIALANKQNSIIPAHKKLMINGSVNFATKMIDVVLALSKTKEVDIPKMFRITLETNP